ncbi:hypothetical protein GCM10028795_08980 [Lysobacter olei]
MDAPSPGPGTIQNPFDALTTHPDRPEGAIANAGPGPDAQSLTTQARNPFNAIGTTATPVQDRGVGTERARQTAASVATTDKATAAGASTPGPAPRSTPERASASAQALAPAAARRASTAAAAGHEPGLLQALLDNIQPAAAPRDTVALDQLARQLDRAPMPAAAAKPAAPATSTPTNAEPPSLRAQLDQCPAASHLQGLRCRRQLCERAGLDPRRCARH